MEESGSGVSDSGCSASDGTASNEGENRDALRVLLSRTFVNIYDGDPNEKDCLENERLSSRGSKKFSLMTYNILADCHAQRDYNMPDSWITEKELSMENRHKLLMEEIKGLDSDIVCLQEVGSEYFNSVLKPSLKEIGYEGLYVARLWQGLEEGEATFYKSSKFILKSSKELVLKDVIGKEISNHIVNGELKSSLLEAIESYAVSLLTRLESKEFGHAISIANVHIAYDKLERQDKQCLQVAATMRELQKLSSDGDGRIICGDFNSWPLSPPQELINNGSLGEKSVAQLKNILAVPHADSKKSTSLYDHIPELFRTGPCLTYKSAYETVTGSDPYTSRFNHDGQVRQVDFIHFSGNLKVQKVLSVPEESLAERAVPNSQFPSDHLALMAEFNYI